MGDKMKLEPEIRLNGFTEPWKRQKFKSIINRVSKTSTENRLPRVEFEDIISGLGQLNKDINKKDSCKSGTEFLIGDILFGKLRPYLKNWLLPDFEGIAVGDFWVFRPNESDSHFIYYLIQSDNFQIVANLTAGTKMPRSDWNIISEAEFGIPTIKEQTAIGEFFRALDENITLHTKKLDGLKQLKKGYLQQMFPQTGEVVPRVRFEGFTEHWTQCKLGDIAIITMGQSPDSANYTQNPEDHILVQGNADIKNGWVTPRVWTTQVTKTAQKGCIIMSVRAPVGDVGKTEFDIVLGRGVCGINGNEFLFQSLGKMKEDGFWAKISTGTTFEAINSTDIKEAMIPIPCNEEQIAIGNFFYNLDDQITTQRQKLEQLKQLKAAYLQKMFV